MEEKKLKVVINKSGNGRITPRVPIPLEWFRKMGLSKDDLEVNVSFNEETGEFKAVKYNK